MGIQKQIYKIRLGLVGGTDVLQQGRPNDAAPPPDSSHRFEVQFVSVGGGSMTEQGQPLGVGDDYTGMEGVLELSEEMIAQAPRRILRASQDLCRSFTL